MSFQFAKIMPERMAALQKSLAKQFGLECPILYLMPCRFCLAQMSWRKPGDLVWRETEGGHQELIPVGSVHTGNQGSRGSRFSRRERRAAMAWQQPMMQGMVQGQPMMQPVASPAMQPPQWPPTGQAPQWPSVAPTVQAPWSPAQSAPAPAQAQPSGTRKWSNEEWKAWSEAKAEKASAKGKETAKDKEKAKGTEPEGGCQGLVLENENKSSSILVSDVPWEMLPGQAEMPEPTMCILQGLNN